MLYWNTNVCVCITSIGMEPLPHIGSIIMSPGLGWANLNKL